MDNRTRAAPCQHNRQAFGRSASPFTSSSWTPATAVSVSMKPNDQYLQMRRLDPFIAPPPRHMTEIYLDG
jgi:hypothetical protein